MVAWAGAGVKRPQRREQAERLGVEHHLRDGFRRAFGWTPKEIALFGKLPDEEVAARIGWTGNAVRVMRTRLGIATARDRRRFGTISDE
jgi:hypothetical protein